MLCNICQKNDATVHLTEIINDQITKLHLCEECAIKKGSEMEDHFGLADLLAGLADFGTQIEKGEELTIKCKNCGMTYRDFKKIGRLGCSECYAYFKKSLEPLLKKIHGSAQHLGKAPTMLPKVVKSELDVEELKRKLRVAIEKEEFEEAAKIRDVIKEFEKKIEKEGK